jgi:hypothetical protein
VKRKVASAQSSIDQAAELLDDPSPSVASQALARQLVVDAQAELNAALGQLSD